MDGQVEETRLVVMEARSIRDEMGILSDWGPAVCIRFISVGFIFPHPFFASSSFSHGGRFFEVFFHSMPLARRCMTGNFEPR